MTEEILKLILLTLTIMCTASLFILSVTMFLLMTGVV